MKKWIKKAWPLLGIGALILLAGIHILLAQRENLSTSLPPDKGAVEGIRLEDIHYSHADPENKVTWLLDAVEVTFSKNKRFMTFRDFRLKVQPQNRPGLHLIGQRGDYDTETGELVMQGDLKGKTDNGYTFETEYVVYNHKKGDLETHESVMITGPFFSVQGRGLSFDVNREILRIYSEVTTCIKDRKWVL
ncbi:MAG: LPS export ABC transporter periplasmic protein LptC [Deltaproteobacteria bacterium]|nr:LPS export ABC transporter periplasmic protein LptC [Deltaproteobacteria bacterium]